MRAENLTEESNDLSEASKERAFTKLWLESQYALGGFVRVQVKSHSDASDIIQEVAAQAATHFNQYYPTRPFSAWIFGIARQRIAEWYRKQNRTPVVFSSETIDILLPHLSALEAETSDRLEALRRCVERLNQKQLRLIDLRYSDQQSSKQIAQAVGSTPASIDVMLCHIRDALRRCINQRMEIDA